MATLTLGRIAEIRIKRVATRDEQEELLDLAARAITPITRRQLLYLWGNGVPDSPYTEFLERLRQLGVPVEE